MRMMVQNDGSSSQEGMCDDVVKAPVSDDLEEQEQNNPESRVEQLVKMVIKSGG
jgi:hypothetical protein